MNEAKKIIVTSLSITAAVSLLITLSLGLIFSLSIPKYAGIFIVATSAQFIIGWMWNSWIQHKQSLFLKQIQNEDVDGNIIIEQYVELACAYCRTRNIVPIILNRKNSFKCTDDKCSQINSVIIQFQTARITGPVIAETELGDVEDYIDPLIEEDIQITKDGFDV